METLKIADKWLGDMRFLYFPQWAKQNPISSIIDNMSLLIYTSEIGLWINEEKATDEFAKKLRYSLSDDNMYAARKKLKTFLYATLKKEPNGVLANVSGE